MPGINYAFFFGLIMVCTLCGVVQGETDGVWATCWPGNFTLSVARGQSFGCCMSVPLNSYVVNYSDTQNQVMQLGSFSVHYQAKYPSTYSVRLISGQTCGNVEKYVVGEQFSAYNNERVCHEGHFKDTKEHQTQTNVVRFVDSATAASQWMVTWVLECENSLHPAGNGECEMTIGDMKTSAEFDVSRIAKDEGEFFLGHC